MQNRSLVTALLLFAILLGVGTFGYRLIEGPQWTLFDGLYMTVITLATVGFGEIHPLTTTGRAFTIILLLLGCGLGAYAISSIAQFIIEGKLRELWGKRRMKDRINALKCHYILCGAGNTGLAVISELKRRGVSFVVVENDSKLVEELVEEDILTVEGDATVDEVLLEAGLDRASGLVTTLPHDADNVFVTLTAKGVNPEIFVVSSSSKMESVPKLKRAGANYVVSPNVIAGTRMASVILRPSVVDFLDATTTGEDHTLQMEEVHIAAGCHLDNKALKDADIRRRSGAIIVSVRKNMRSVINPEPTYIFEAGDILIVLGDRDQISKMCELATGSSRA